MLHWSQERKQERTALLNPHTPETHSIPSLQAHFHLLFALLSGLFSKPEAGSNERSYSCLQACGSALSLIPLSLRKTGFCRDYHPSRHHCFARSLGADFQEFQILLSLLQALDCQGPEFTYLNS